jgi:hypothetical protein
MIRLVYPGSGFLLSRSPDQEKALDPGFATMLVTQSLSMFRYRVW